MNNLSLGKLEYFVDPATGVLTSPIDYSGALPGRKDLNMDLDATARDLLDKILPKVPEHVHAEYGRARSGLGPEHRPRRLLNGDIVPLGDARGTSGLGGGGSPAHVRNGSLGSTSYSIRKVFLALREKNMNLCPLEYELSRKMEPWLPTTAGGINIPLGPDALYRVPGHEEQIESFAAELKGLFPVISIDPQERAWLEAKAGMRSKAMSPLDESAGGSLLPFPEIGTLDQLLRAATWSGRAGARVVPLGATGSLQIPRAMSDVSWQPLDRAALPTPRRRAPGSCR